MDLKMPSPTSSLLLLLALACLFSSSCSTRGRAGGKRLSSDGRSQLVDMIPQESCFYQAYIKRLTCNCNSTDTAAYVHLRMKYYMFSTDDEIRQVYIRQCRELVVKLDLREMNAHNVPFHFNAIGRVEIEEILFEPRYTDRQELELVFNNVNKLYFEKIFVEDTLMLSASNVKELHFVKSTFAHIPPRGFEVSDAKLLDIRDSTFLRVDPQSIVVEKTKEVSVIKNEMSINALDAVYAKDGSHLMISCNRLIGQAVSPECSKMTTTITTTTTTTTTTRPVFMMDNNKGNLRESGDKSQVDEGRSMIPELIAGVATGVAVICLICLIFVCFVKRKKRDPPKQESVEVPVVEEAREAAEAKEVKSQPPAAAAAAAKDKTNSPASVPKAAEPKESDALLLGAEDDDDDDRPRFSTPIWLDEIHKNKIFNRQKSMLSEEGLKDIAEGRAEPKGNQSGAAADAPPPTPPTPRQRHTPAGATVSEEEAKESSRTESDEDFERQQQHQQPHARPAVAEPPTSPPHRLQTSPRKDLDTNGVHALPDSAEGQGGGNANAHVSHV